MAYQINIRLEADKDIEQAARWYENQQQGLGAEFFDEVQYAIDRIQENPFLYAIRHRNTRQAILGKFPFNIFYRVQNGKIVVYAVLHGHRNPQHWQKRLI